MNCEIWIGLKDADLAKKWAGLLSIENFKCRIFENPSQYMDFLYSISINKPISLSLLEIHPKAYHQQMIMEILQRSKTIPVILVSEPSSISDSLISELLMAGADDYIDVKIGPKVLIAKIRAHIRRMDLLTTDLKPSGHKVMTKDKKIILDLISNSVLIKSAKKEKSINLTKTELQILSILLHNEDHIVERNDLFRGVWKEKCEYMNPQILDKYIEIIRKKLKPLGKNIRTVYGQGYMYTNKVKI